jgi:DNA-binding MarR family transcriptional regulator
MRNDDLVKAFEESKEMFHRIAKKIGDDFKGSYSMPEYGLMVILKRLGRARLKEIAAYIGAKPLVCLRLGILERKKFVARIRDETDRRNVYYCVAPKGEAFINRVREALTKNMCRVLEPLGNENMTELILTVKKMNEILTKVI